MARINLLLSQNFAEAVRAHAAFSEHGFTTRALPELIQLGLCGFASLTNPKIKAVVEAIKVRYAVIKRSGRNEVLMSAYTDDIDREALRCFMAVSGLRPKSRAYRALIAVGLSADSRATSYAAEDVRELLGAISAELSR